MRDWIRWLFCQHDWEQYDKEVKRAPIEAVLKTISSISKLNTGTPGLLLNGTVVWLLKCNKCKRVKTIRERL